MTTEIEDALRSAPEAVLSVVLPVVELATSLLRAGWPVLVGLGLAVAVVVMVLSAIVRAFSAEARHKRRLRTWKARYKRADKQLKRQLSKQNWEGGLC